jgi:TolB-like protein
MSLLAELNRRRVFRALVGYGIGAFAVLQIVEPIMHSLHWPDAVLSYVVVALAAGFPIVVTLAWVFDVSAAGIGRTAPADGGASGLRLGLLLGCIGLVAAAPGLIWFFVWPGRAGGGSGTAPTNAAVTLAVLPLANISGEAGQEYFSDGLTEEIIGKLSQLRGLSVTARSSVAKYKRAPAGAREIGADLGVAYILEGSVRRAGNRIRVSTTLVNTANSFHVWSEEIDGQLDDVFAVQERIASRIVESLHLKLSPDEASALSKWGTHNAAAYDEYLQGQALLEHFHLLDRLHAGRAHFDRALAIDPGFAPAMAGLASVEAQIYRNFESDPRRLDHGEALAARALALDPRLGRARMAAGEIRAMRYDYTRASAMFRQLVTDEPRNYEAWDNLCWSLGYQWPPPLAEAEEACRRAVSVNPGYAEPWYHLARILIPQRRINEAAQALKHIEEHFPGSSLINAGQFWLLIGTSRPREALGAVMRNPKTNLTNAWAAMALAEAGEADRAFEQLDSALASGYRDVAELHSSPYFASLRRDPRFATVLAKYGVPR